MNNHNPTTEYQYHYLNNPTDLETSLWYKCSQNPEYDGPNTVWSTGLQYWHKDNLLHRTTGPALINEQGQELWFIHGKNITDEVNAWLKLRGYTLPFSQAAYTDFMLTFG